MGRHRKFDIDQAILDAQQMFWTHGYEATSITDLLEATGLQRGSLYKAFGDKHGLFLRTLSRYQEQAFEQLAQLLMSGKGPADGLNRWLQAIADGCPQNGPRAGCYMVNCTTELAPHDDQVAELIARNTQQVVALVEATVRAGQEAGELRRQPGAKEMARHLLLVVVGLSVEGKAGTPASARKAQAEFALRLIQIQAED